MKIFNIKKLRALRLEYRAIYRELLNENDWKNLREHGMRVALSCYHRTNDIAWLRGYDCDRKDFLRRDKRCADLRQQLSDIRYQFEQLSH